MNSYSQILEEPAKHIDLKGEGDVMYQYNYPAVGTIAYHSFRSHWNHPKIHSHIVAGFRVKRMKNVVHLAEKYSIAS